jgi:hypothetical protein
MNYRRTLQRQTDADCFTRMITIGDGGYPFKYFAIVETQKRPRLPAAAVLAAPETIKYPIIEIGEAKQCAEHQVADSQNKGYVPIP